MLGRLKRNKQEPVVIKPELVSQPVDELKDDYQKGLNYQQLAEKYNLTVEEVAETVGA